MTLDIYFSSQDAPEHLADFHRETYSTVRFRRRAKGKMTGVSDLKPQQGSQTFQVLTYNNLSSSAVISL